MRHYNYSGGGYILLKNLKIGARIIIGFFAMVVISCAIGIVGILNLNNVQGSYARDFRNTALALEYVEKMSSHFQQVRVNIFSYIVHSDKEEDRDYYTERIAEHEAEIANAISSYNKILEAYDASEVATELGLLGNIQTAVNEFSADRKQLMDDYAAGLIGKDELIAKISKGGDVYALSDLAETAISELINYNINYASEQIENNDFKAKSSIIAMIVVLSIGIVIALVLGIIISTGISAPINKVVKAADQLAKGDMGISFDIRSKDETGKLVEAFRNLVDSTKEQVNVIEKVADGDLTVNVPIRSEKDILGQKLSEMVHKIHDLVMNIDTAAEQVSSGANQIANSSMELSQGATEQASSIEELTALMEDISSQTEINAKNANQAGDMAEQAKNFAVTGNAHMAEMLKAMDEINESSNNINRIIKVIDDIAFQTNILALNAAVEAARAGLHGKGFAVVADEVRTLAGRSANAAKETAALIEDSIKKSEVGAKIAKETAEALNRIVQEVESVSNLVSDIRKASNEQAAAIAQINQGIMQVSQVVQENSATSEESAAASEELTSQAMSLKQMVERFKLNRTYAGNNA